MLTKKQLLLNKWTVTSSTTVTIFCQVECLGYWVVTYSLFLRSFCPIKYFSWKMSRSQTGLWLALCVIQRLSSRPMVQWMSVCVCHCQISVDRWPHDKDTRHSFEPSTSVRRTHTKQITCDITNATRANFDRFLCVCLCESVVSWCCICHHQIQCQ